MKAKLRRSTRRAFLSIAFVPILLSGLAWWMTSHLRTQVGLVQHTQEVRNGIDTLLLLITNAETGQRGFLLTGKSIYLEPFSSAKTKLTQQFQELRQLTADNPSQQQTLSLLERLVNAKLEELTRTVQLRQSEGPAAALAVVQTDQGQQYMKQIRAALETMSNQERQLLEQRLRQQRVSEAGIWLVFTTGITTTLAMLIWAGRQIENYANARDRAEAQVHAANAELERRVAQRTAELEAANVNLQRSNQDLERFAYVASHDLQEPLRMVGSYVGLLGRRYQGKLDEDADKYIRFAVDGAKRMQNLVNDLLAYSRAGTQSLQPTETDLGAMLRQVQENLHLAIQESGAVVTHDALPTLAVDAGKLSLVLQNLLTNAIKFRRPEEPPRIHIGARQDSADWVFCVRDNGIGFDPKYADRIFVIFQRLHGVGKYPGTGIGLAICKRIVEGHGGRIWAESTPGAGSTFYFALPPASASR